MSSYIDPQVLYVQILQLDGLLRGIKGILEQSYTRYSDYWATVHRYDELRIERAQLHDEYEKSMKNQTKLFEELRIKLIKPMKHCLVEESKVTSSEEKTFEDVPDSEELVCHQIDNMDVQDSEDLICHQIDIPIHEVQVGDVDNVKIVHEDINDSKSLLEDVKESFQTNHVDKSC
ncbi:hypothetical protein POM88_034331 [Heracleum sosnowskyi]|uniref:Uncharacterized protein n=1 Tax=Heracleum sosnowskyi TaxID=360622 RepID=A0AAD8MD19_9APIA|nr:hypothetical protein POM88_034331 [Heracleum sosnowskyi]